MKINKSITFIATSATERLLYDLIIQEAKNRDYMIRLTEDLFAKDEIVFYCQHNCFPSKRRAKISCVMLHDLGQAHNVWPNFWAKESWEDFDIGFLPNMHWEKMWKENACYHFAYPRYGCFNVGWPRAEILNSDIFLEKTKEIAKKIDLKMDRPTILYAPSWENDNKQIDFVNAMKDMNVNMLIKQAPWNEKNYPQICKEIKKMEEACRGMKDVYILDPSENIFIAMALSDILVSEESSVLLENMLLGKPSVGVSDWLIPDEDPPRQASIPFEHVIKTKKAELRETIFNILSNYDKYSEAVKKYANENFPNNGKTSQMVMNIIDDFVEFGLRKRRLNYFPSSYNFVEPPNKHKDIPKNLMKTYKYWKNLRSKIQLSNHYYFNFYAPWLTRFIGVFNKKVQAKQNNFYLCGTFYFDTGKDFNEQETIHFQHEKGKNFIHNKIILPKNIKSVRFDPVEGCGCFLQNLVIKSDNGEIVNYQIMNGFKSENDGIVFTNTDPQILININETANKKITVQCDIWLFN
jgi:hypothetical protein